jgi:hypothetical protein
MHSGGQIMLAAVTPNRAAVENAMPCQTPMITTFYDLIAALSTASKPGEEDLVTAAVMHLSRTGRLHFLAEPRARVVVSASRDTSV